MYPSSVSENGSFGSTTALDFMPCSFVAQFSLSSSRLTQNCQCRDKTPAELPILSTRAAVSLGGDAVGTLQ